MGSAQSDLSLRGVASRRVPDMVALGRDGRRRKRRVLQAERTSSANIQRPGRTWLVWGTDSRLVWLQGRDLCFRRVTWKLSGITGGEQGWKQDFLSFLLQKLPLLLNKTPM